MNSLNPYSNGTTIEHEQRFHSSVPDHVLILILMEQR